MLYLIFNVDDEPTETIKEWQRERAHTPGRDAHLTFTFVPAPGGCRLEVHQGQLDEEGAVLGLDLDDCLHIKEEPYAGDAFRWRTPQLRGAKPEIGTTIGVDQIIFFIDGEIMEKLRGLGWERERLGAYEYRFHFHGQQMEIWVRDRESGEAVQLTGDGA